MKAKHLFWLTFFVFASFLCFSCEPQDAKKLKLDSFVPTFMFSKKKATLTVRGTGFSEGLSGWLESQQGKQVVFDGVTVVDETTATVALPASTLEPGLYSLHLTYPGQDGKKAVHRLEVFPEALVILFLDAEQGDATLILSPSGESMLIDGGKEDQGKPLHQALLQLGVKKVDYVLATHYDADHVGGLKEIFWGDKKIQEEPIISVTKAVVDRGGWSKNSSYRSFRERLVAIHKELKTTTLSSFPVFSLGDGVKVRVRTVNGHILKKSGGIKSIDCKDDENCRSIGTSVEFGKFHMWTAGDLTGGGNSTFDMETPLGHELGKVHVYRAHHHGSKTSSNKAFLEKITPDVTVLSAGNNNRYCHPSTTVLQRLLEIPASWVFLTTFGIKELVTCKETTNSVLAKFQNRGLENSGALRLIVEKDKFTIRSLQQDFEHSWPLK